MSRKQKPRQVKPSPDKGLAKENFPGLNKTFYGMTPHGYLRRRLTSLVLWYGDPPGLDDVLSDGFTVDDIAVNFDAEENSKEERERFAVIEAEVLLHHVSETLLRLYLVHSKESPCPWLDLSRQMNPGLFKKEVDKLRKRLTTDEERSRIEAVFFATTQRESLTPTPTQEQWDAASRNISLYLGFYAAHFLDSAPYNAAKHGLALRAENWKLPD